jgi:hypothetical protein
MSAAVEVAEVAEGVVVAKDMDLSCTRCIDICGVGQLV